MTVVAIAVFDGAEELDFVLYLDPPCPAVDNLFSLPAEDNESSAALNRSWLGTPHR